MFIRRKTLDTVTASCKRDLKFSQMLWNICICRNCGPNGKKESKNNSELNEAVSQHCWI